MKYLLPALSFVFGTMSLHGGVRLDVSVVTEADVKAGMLPVVPEITQEGDRDLMIKLTLNKPFGIIGEFATYELRVAKNPIVPSNLKRDYLPPTPDYFSRREVSHDKVTKFKLKRGEVPMAYVVVTSWTGQHLDGWIHQRCVCLPVKYFVFEKEPNQ